MASHLRFQSAVARTALAFAVVVVSAGAGATERTEAGFASLPSGGATPSGWTDWTFRDRRPTRYRLVDDPAAGVVLQAASRGGASGLLRRLDVDLGRSPRLEWRWKVERPLDGSRLSTKGGDDFAARVFVLFGYDPESVGLADRLRFEAQRALAGQDLPWAALSYVWGGSDRTGSNAPSPHTDRVHAVVVESGPNRAGEWVRISRDVAADYRRTFGGEPPPVVGVAVMTDTDDTGEATTAWYGGLTFR